MQVFHGWWLLDFAIALDYQPKFYKATLRSAASFFCSENPLFIVGKKLYFRIITSSDYAESLYDYASYKWKEYLPLLVLSLFLVLIVF